MARGKKKNPRQDENVTTPEDVGDANVTSGEGKESGGGKPPWKTIAIVAASVVLVLGLAAITWSTVLGDDEPEVDAASTAGVSSAAQDTNDIYGDVIAEANFLGDMSAPVELIEFSSLDCERCATYRTETVPLVIDEFVRPGKLRLDLELLVPEGDEHIQLATEAAYALAFDNRIWHFTDIFIRDRAENPEGEPTNEYLIGIAGQTDLIYEPDFTEAAGDELVERALARAESLADEWMIDRENLPQFLIGPLGGPYEVMTADPTDPDAFLAAIEEQLTRYGVAP